MLKNPKIRTALSLLLTGLISWVLLPVILFGLSNTEPIQYLEVLFWQFVALLGWPFAVMGFIIILISGQGNPQLQTLALISMYPIMIALLLHVFIAKRVRRWEPVLLHLLIVLSFAAVWVQVHKGVEIMLG
jgi:hypothetical protein